MHYVGLSRVKIMENIHILKLNEKKISVSRDETQEMSRLRSDAVLNSCVPILKNIPENFKLVFYNSRSLHLHIKDLVLESNLLQSDIIVIGESRLKDSDRNSEYEIEGFRIYSFDSAQTNSTTCNRPFRGMVIYSKVTFSKIENMNLCDDMETVFASFSHFNLLHQVFFSLLLSPKSHKGQLCRLLLDILKVLDPSKPIIIMGDTNDDFLTQTELSKFVVKNKLKQHVTFSTTDYGTCLDHVYTNMISNEISCATLESYYSDHKPVVAYL